MKQQSLLIQLGCGAIGLGLPLLGCSGYEEDPAVEQMMTTTGDASSGASDGTTGDATTGDATTGDITGSGGAATDTSGDTGSGATDSGSGGAAVQVEIPPASCENVTACGGNVEGVWFAHDSATCLPVTGKANLQSFGIGCSEGDVTGELKVSGNWTLSADGMISDNTTTVGDMELKLGPECRDVSGTVVTCDGVTLPLASIGLDDLACVDDPDSSDGEKNGCICTGKVSQSGGAGYITYDATTAGIYSIEGNAITTTEIRNVDYSYCVDGEFLHATPTTKPEALGTTSGTIIFQRQHQ